MRVGVLGGGQLGRMLALAGYPLGARFRFFDTKPDATAGAVGELVVGDYEDEAALARFADGLDVVTYEFENVPVASARLLADRLPVHPSPAALEAAQDRLTEKRFFREHGLATAPFRAVDSRGDLVAALQELGAPAVLKTRRFGYDGKGQVVIDGDDPDVDAAWEALGGSPLILEGFVPFERELSILSVGGRGGERAFYPLVENHHSDGILRLSHSPAPDVPESMQRRAEEYATRILDELGYVGVLAIELFEVDGELLANEMAPRVHNSGHWSIEGAEASQFENHIRAVLGLPLGPTSMVGPCAMLNLIGTVPDTAEMLEIPGAHLHLYDKAPRPGRKLGHVTIRADDRSVVLERLERLERCVRG